MPVLSSVRSETPRSVERPPNLPIFPAKCSDILIAGGGFAGVSLAIALRQSLGGNFTVTLADPELGKTGRDARASAIAAAPRRMFEAEHRDPFCQVPDLLM